MLQACARNVRILTWRAPRRRLEAWLIRTGFIFCSILGRTRKRPSKRGTSSTGGGRRSGWTKGCNTKWTGRRALALRLRPPRNQRLRKKRLRRENRKKKPRERRPPKQGKNPANQHLQSRQQQNRKPPRT